MQSAGEAGSLLKIEEEIRSAIADAKKQWKEGPKLEQTKLFGEEFGPAMQKELKIDLSGITDEQFWERVEREIYGALEKFAGQAENGGGFQRRLFAEDAARGFAFIDVCRKRYDVAVMNPPFGAFPKQYKGDARKTYPDSSNDIFAAFIDRFVQHLDERGRLGAITSRACFFTTSFIDWRANVIAARCCLDTMVDLGEAVMDDAMVEAAAYILAKKASAPRNLPTVWLREFVVAERDSRLLAKITSLESVVSGHSPSAFVSNISSFDMLNGKPFVYWVDSRTIRRLSVLPTLEPAAADVRKGLRTGDNFRFVRCLWEVPPEALTTRLSQEAGEETLGKSRFVPLVLSGSSQPWFAPIIVALNWQANGRELRQFVLKYGTESRLIQGKDHYFRPGISWTRRATRFIPYAIPAGCIPTGSRPMAFPTNCDGFLLLGVTASNCASAFMRFYGEKFLWPNFLEGKVKLVPWPSMPQQVVEELVGYVSEQIRSRRSAYRSHEPFHEFLCPYLREDREQQRQLEYSPASLLGEERDALISNCYGLSETEASGLCQDLRDALTTRFAGPEPESDDEKDDDGDMDSVIDVGPEAWAHSIVSFSAGVAFGRWDIRHATGEKAAPELPDPFAPLPICPPGQLQNAQGLPVEKTESGKLKAENYPVEIPWDGILVDDPNHPLDIERHVREVIEIIWKNRAEAIEHEACEILGVKSLRDYFRKSAGFFPDHLKRYSKSRRQAPIYWPISTSSASYTIWIYYHRFTKDSFYRVREIATEKLAFEERKLTVLHQDFGPEPGASQRKQLADQESFIHELRAFREEIVRVTPLWNPDLNDGVIINFAPFWRLIAHRPWQQDVKACWDSIVAAKYDWSHLAMHLWPERVVPKCQTDRSLAIAHSLDEAFWEEDRSGKAKSKKVAKTEIQKLISDRASPAVKEALNNLLTTPMAGAAKNRGRKQ